RQRAGVELAGQVIQVDAGELFQSRMRVAGVASGEYGVTSGDMWTFPPRGGQLDAVDALAPGAPAGQHWLASRAVAGALPGHHRVVTQCVEIGVQRRTTIN